MHIACCMDVRWTLHGSWIVVPYCTGDVHLGDADTHKHKHTYIQHGRQNLRLMVARALTTFPSVDTFVVTGESAGGAIIVVVIVIVVVATTTTMEAGGFGAAANYWFLRGYWPGAKHAVMLDDSGPILDDKAIAPCLQEKWRHWWNINATLPPGCPCIGKKGNIVSAWNYTIRKFPDDRLGP